MAKLIMVADDVYAELKARKGKDSFSVAIRNALGRKTNRDALLEFAGRGGVSEKKVKELGKEWKKWTNQYA